MTNMAAHKQFHNATDTSRQRIIFALLPDYFAMSLTNALETLRIANKLLNKKYFDWIICSADGQPVQSSLGMTTFVDSEYADCNRNDIVIVCSGDAVLHQRLSPTIGWLRRCRSIGCKIGGFYSGAYVLARAGLLDGHRAAIHWKFKDGFEESFQSVELVDLAQSESKTRPTTAGGVSEIDVMLSLISSTQSEKLSNLVAAELNYSTIRSLQYENRLNCADRVGFQHPKISPVIMAMEENCEDPLSPRELAELVNISTRQLERLFRKFLHTTPTAFYRELRLRRAYNLLTQSTLPITEIFLACGFSTPSGFAKNFKKQFGATPRRFRDPM